MSLIDEGALRSSIDEAVRRIVRDGAEGALQRGVAEYLREHGREVLADAVEIERLQRKERLQPAEVERLYGVSVGTLANWRSQSLGPQFERFGRAILYPHEALRRFVSAGRVLTADDETPVPARTESRNHGRSRRACG